MLTGDLAKIFMVLKQHQTGASRMHLYQFGLGLVLHTFSVISSFAIRNSPVDLSNHSPILCPRCLSLSIWSYSGLDETLWGRSAGCQRAAYNPNVTIFHRSLPDSKSLFSKALPSHFRDVCSWLTLAIAVSIIIYDHTVISLEHTVLSGSVVSECNILPRIGWSWLSQYPAFNHTHASTILAL